jgi:YD repeat-containing protein
LTPIAGFLRDPNIPASRLNSGSTVGNGGQGPTTWTEYLDLGVVFAPSMQRIVAHTKDGTADGRYVKTFLDGLGRIVQTRSEVDPATSLGGAQEVVGTQVYDIMGRVGTEYVPCFSSSSDAVTGTCTSRATNTTYDALARVTAVTPPSSPPTRTVYQGSGTQWLSTVTDAKGNVAASYTNVLGQTVRISRQDLNGTSNCPGGWCTTFMDYDAAGHLLRATDPMGFMTSFLFDGLGRKKQMIDPDMGTWTYDYDDTGNLIQQIDAKGQTVQMFYDSLNRITRRVLPNSSVPGADDTTYFYDGDPPP